MKNDILLGTLITIALIFILAHDCNVTNMHSKILSNLCHFLTE